MSICMEAPAGWRRSIASCRIPPASRSCVIRSPPRAGRCTTRSSFARRVACETPAVDAIFLIGTPVNKYDFGYLRHCERPMLFVHGTHDEHGDVGKLETLVQEVRNAESVTITGADHFFTKQLEALEETMRTWAEEVLEQ